MIFPLQVIYLSREYTYDVETTDGIHFTCRCRLTDHEEFGIPPEVIELERGKEPRPRESGAYRVQLHTDLMEGIEAFMKEG